MSDTDITATISDATDINITLDDVGLSGSSGSSGTSGTSYELGTIDHNNDLINLQGGTSGTSGEYYHLSENEHTQVQNAVYVGEWE